MGRTEGGPSERGLRLPSEFLLPPRCQGGELGPLDELAGEESQGDAIAHLELSEDVVQVGVDRLFADPELPRDLSVAQSQTDFIDDLGLPLGQMAVHAVSGHAEVGEPGEVLERVRRHEAVGPDLAGRDRPDRPHDGLEIELLADEARRPGAQDALDGVGARSRGEDEEPGGGGFPAQTRDEALTARAECLEVEQKDAGLLGAQEVANRRLVGRMAGEHEPGLGGEDAAEDLADERRTRGDRDPQRRPVGGGDVRLSDAVERCLAPAGALASARVSGLRSHVDA